MIKMNVVTFLKSNTKLYKMISETIINQNNSSVPRIEEMSTTNAEGKCYVLTNAFGDINYSDEKPSKTE